MLPWQILDKHTIVDMYCWQNKSTIAYIYKTMWALVITLHMSWWLSPSSVSFLSSLKPVKHLSAKIANGPLQCLLLCLMIINPRWLLLHVLYIVITIELWNMINTLFSETFRHTLKSKRDMNDHFRFKNKRWLP